MASPSTVNIDPVELAALVRDSRIEQGLPPTITDTAALARVARLLTARPDDPKNGGRLSV